MLTRLRDALESRYGASLVAILVGGLLIRLPFGTLDLGVSRDMATLVRWARTIADGGLIELTGLEGMGTVYPPLGLFMVGLAGYLEELAPVVMRGGDALIILLIKFPVFLADLAIAAVIALVLQGRRPALRLLAAAAFVFNPAYWFLSAMWGQTDSVFTLFLLLSVAALQRGGPVSAWLAYGVGVASKLQSLGLGPLMFLVTLRTEGPGALLRGIAGMVTLLTLLALPWIVAGELGPYLQHLGKPGTALDMNAFNLWYLLWLGQVTGVPSSVQVGPLPVSAAQVGYLLLAIVTLAVSVAIWWRGRAVGLALPAAILLMAPFLVLTHMHERYLAPAPVFVLLVAAGWERVHSRWLWVGYAAVSATLFANLVLIGHPVRLARHFPPYDLAYTGILGLSILAGVMALAVFVGLLYLLFNDARWDASSPGTT